MPVDCNCSFLMFLSAFRTASKVYVRFLRFLEMQLTASNSWSFSGRRKWRLERACALFHSLRAQAVFAHAACDIHSIALANAGRCPLYCVRRRARGYTDGHQHCIDCRMPIWWVRVVPGCCRSAAFPPTMPGTNRATPTAPMVATRKARCLTTTGRSAGLQTTAASPCRSSDFS